MALKKTTPGSGNPGGVSKAKISSSVSVLGKEMGYFTTLPNLPRKSLTGTQLKEAQALAARIKAVEAKAAKNKKADAKIIKKQNKKPLKPNPAKATAVGLVSKKPVVKVKPRIFTGRGGGMRGGVAGSLDSQIK